MSIKHKTSIFMIIMLFGFSSSFAHAIGLKENSIVQSGEITLGDIFYNLPRDENRVLGAAPRPGQDMVLNARTLLRIALALDLPWRPTDSTDSITLTRAATVINYEEITESLKLALAETGMDGNYDIAIPVQYHKIILPQDQPATLEVTRFTTDADRKTFQATIAAPSEENPIQHFQINGRISAVIEVPVLSQNVHAGEVVREDHIKFIKLQERDFSHDMIVETDQLVGMTARRVVLADRPVRAAEIIAPQVIERGEIVTLAVDAGVMKLTAQARALQDGAKGDIIRVVNTSSNQTVRAVVTGERQVAVIEN
ncbi:MAG: flagellar basal body P-ring formation protein FlgA [Alphaproteobacteria bacterium]|nr:flagellar basal body P-ring formation protein FlgA [Alphaproteobacteria bacterium]